MRFSKHVVLALLDLTECCGSVWGKPAGVLLQEGIYQQETTGNLDKAIDIYKQVLVDAHITEQIAAQANYQLGLCYLKKGDKAKAADYFRQVVTKYPKQAELVSKANQQLEKMSPKPVEADDGIPRIVKTNPQAFDDRVSTFLKEITVTFDRKMMDQSWSWTGGGDTYPKTTGKPHYDAQKTTCTLPVQLEPGKVYWIGVNAKSFKNFKTPQRVPAPWYVIPADNKWFARLAVAAVIGEKLKSLKLAYPEISGQQKEALAEARAALESEK